MSQRTGGIRRPLANAGVYSLVQRALGAEHVRETFVRDYLRPSADERVLDLGCGPGDIIELLPPVHYLGVDNSSEYVEAGRERFGERGRFVCADVRALALDPADRFDAAISIGVLHHLDDAGAAAMVNVAARALEPGGRLVTIDPGFAEPQPRFARWLIGRDRGQAVRDPDGYRELMRARFEDVSVSVHHDLARVPYTHVVVEARRPRGD